MLRKSTKGEDCSSLNKAIGMLTPTRGTDKRSRDGHRGSEEPLHAGQARWSPSLNLKPTQESQPALTKEPEPLAEPPS
eukprot:8239860-Heterocapsa_arctica.AAC.1